MEICGWGLGGVIPLGIGLLGGFIAIVKNVKKCKYGRSLDPTRFPALSCL
jgi:hypothetical protein